MWAAPIQSSASANGNRMLSQDMSKAATVVAGTLFHELGHTLGLTHGGSYYYRHAGQLHPDL